MGCLRLAYNKSESSLKVAYRNPENCKNQDSSYYPFGLTMAGISSKALAFGSPSNKQKYNGKEEQRQEMTDRSGLEWTDYGARMYDNQIGRWNVIDPLAEETETYSTFVFCFNNPIKFIDDDGRSADDYYEIITNDNGFNTLNYLGNDGQGDGVRMIDNRGNKKTGEVKKVKNDLKQISNKNTPEEKKKELADGLKKNPLNELYTVQDGVEQNKTIKDLQSKANGKTEFGRSIVVDIINKEVKFNSRLEIGSDIENEVNFSIPNKQNFVMIGTSHTHDHNNGPSSGNPGGNDDVRILEATQIPGYVLGPQSIYLMYTDSAGKPQFSELPSIPENPIRDLLKKIK